MEVYVSKLTAKDRKAIPKSEFGLPGSRKYPVPDKSHAANAKARATQQVNKGNLSEAAAAKIRAKANKVLGSVILLAVLGCVQAHAAVRTLQVTLGAGVTSVLSPLAHQQVLWVTIQNNATHSIRIGDANVTSTRGLALNSGGGSFFVGPSSSGSARDLGSWYIIGTSADVIDVIYDDGE
jgi:hypothetical protein